MIHDRGDSLPERLHKPVHGGDRTDAAPPELETKGVHTALNFVGRWGCFPCIPLKKEELTDWLVQFPPSSNEG